MIITFKSNINDNYDYQLDKIYLVIFWIIIYVIVIFESKFRLIDINILQYLIIPYIRYYKTS